MKVDREQLWQVFHELWTRDVGTPGYVKRKWVELESLLLGLLVEAGASTVEGEP